MLFYSRLTSRKVGQGRWAFLDPKPDEGFRRYETGRKRTTQAFRKVILSRLKNRFSPFLHPVRATISGRIDNLHHDSASVTGLDCENISAGPAIRGKSMMQLDLQLVFKIAIGRWRGWRLLHE